MEAMRAFFDAFERCRIFANFVIDLVSTARQPLPMRIQSLTFIERYKIIADSHRHMTEMQATLVRNATYRCLKRDVHKASAKAIVVIPIGVPSFWLVLTLMALNESWCACCGWVGMRSELNKLKYMLKY
jgi:hypothetical protein